MLNTRNEDPLEFTPTCQEGVSVIKWTKIEVETDNSHIRISPSLKYDFKQLEILLFPIVTKTNLKRSLQWI